MMQVIDMLLEKLPEIVAEEEAAGDGGGSGMNPEGSFSQVGEQGVGTGISRWCLWWWW